MPREVPGCATIGSNAGGHCDAPQDHSRPRRNQGRNQQRGARHAGTQEQVPEQLVGRVRLAGALQKGAAADHKDRGGDAGHQHRAAEQERPGSLGKSLKRFPHGCHPTSSKRPGRGIPGW